MVDFRLIMTWWMPKRYIWCSDGKVFAVLDACFQSNEGIMALAGRGFF